MKILQEESENLIDSIDYPKISYISLFNLSQLDLSNCNQIADTGISHLSSLINLNNLNLSWCDQITDSGISNLSCENISTLSLNNCKNLSKLNLSGCISLSKLNIIPEKIKEID